VTVSEGSTPFRVILPQPGDAGRVGVCVQACPCQWAWAARKSRRTRPDEVGLPYPIGQLGNVVGFGTTIPSTGLFALVCSGRGFCFFDARTRRSSCLSRRCLFFRFPIVSSDGEVCRRLAS
jgi:hypothetical protein